MADLLPGVTITHGPSDWQILQRGGGGGGADIELAGRHRAAAEQFRVQARVVVERNGAPVSAAHDWRDAERAGDDAWQITLRGVPAGGLYRVETRIMRPGAPDPRPTRGDSIHHLGVGDIWVIAGQSNASGTGLGPVDDPPTLGVHLFGNDECWRLATHPLEDARDTRHPITVHGVFHAHSAWLAFGRRLLEETGVPVGLVPTALGGSSIVAWNPERSDDLFANLLAMATLAHRPGTGPAAAGVVWYQGESDIAPKLRDEYPERFRRLAAALRERLGEIPILTAQLGRYAGASNPTREEGWTILRETQRQLADELPGVVLVPTIDLPLSDEIHISAAGNVLLGQRFAVEALRAVYGRDLAPTGHALRGVEWAEGRQAVRLRFDPPAAEWWLPGRADDFLLRDAAGDVPLGPPAAEVDGSLILPLGRAAERNAILTCHPGCEPPARLRDRDQRPVLAFTRALPN